MAITTATDSGNGYGARGCAADGCGAILAYPDEGDACAKHTCEVCGAVVGSLEVFPLPYLDGRGGYYLDDTATACLGCYGAMMSTLTLGGMLRVQYKRRG